MVPKSHGKGNPPVGKRLQNLQGRWNVRPAKDNVSGMDDKVWFYAVQGFVHTVQGPLRAGISYNMMRIGKLQHGKTAVGPKGKIAGHVPRGGSL